LPHSILGGRISGVIGLSQWCQPFSAAPFLFLFDIFDQCQRITMGGARGGATIHLFGFGQANHHAKPAAQKKSSNP